MGPLGERETFAIGLQLATALASLSDDSLTLLFEGQKRRALVGGREKGGMLRGNEKAVW